MNRRSYKNYSNRKHTDCNIKILDYNVSFVINKVASEKGISKSKLIEDLIYKEYSSYFHEIPESLESIISNMRMNFENGYITNKDAFEYYIRRLESLKGGKNE